MADAKVIGQVVAGSQPSLSVTDRTDGGGYTVTAGARSLSITAEAGATLSTTVTDQDNASITVTDSTSTTPSWTAPGGGTTGADYCVQVTATKGGYTSQVSWSELVDGSGGGGSGATLVYEQLFTDVTTGSRTTTGSQTIYAGDGTTPIGTFEATTSGTLSAWSADWSNADGLKLSGVAKGGGSSGTAIIAFNPPAGWLSGVDFSNDILVAEIIYEGNALPGDGSIWFGAAPYGSLALAVNDGRDFKVTRTAGAYSWLTERWGNYDSDAVASLGTTAVNTDVLFHMELNGGLRTMLKQARSSFVAPASWRSFAWDGRGIGAMLVAVDDDPATERYAAAGGFAFVVAVNNNDAANPGASAIRGIRVWKKGE